MDKDLTIPPPPKPPKKRKAAVKHYQNPLISDAARTEKDLVENEYHMTTLKNLSLYVDDEGNSSDGPKGIAVQTQIRIKKHFDEARADFNEPMFDLLIALYRNLSRKINEMVRQKVSRPDIKLKIYEIIENYGNLARTEK
jgi:hypothetical protein